MSTDADANWRKNVAGLLVSASEAFLNVLPEILRYGHVFGSGGGSPRQTTACQAPTMEMTQQLSWALRF